jgi:hypothetical protein
LDRGDVGDMPAKQRYSLPIQAPGSDSVDPDRLAAAVQRFGQVKACTEAKREAARRLVAADRELDRDPPRRSCERRAFAGELETDGGTYLSPADAAALRSVAPPRRWRPRFWSSSAPD